MASYILVGTDPREEQLIELAVRIEEVAYALVLLSGVMLTAAIALLILVA